MLRRSGNWTRVKRVLKRGASMEEVLLAATKLNRNGIVTKLAAAGADVNTTQCDPRPDAPPKPHAGSAVAGLYAGLGYSPDHPLHTRHVTLLAADGDSMLHVAAKLGYKLTMQKLLRVRRRPGALPLAARRSSLAAGGLCARRPSCTRYAAPL